MSLHYDPNNPWAWWTAALAGDVGAIHDGKPQQGFYRVRRGKGGDWQRVAIWLTAENEWAALRDGTTVSGEDIWTFACRNPISHEAYQRHEKGEGWADEPPAPIGHNSNTPSDPFEAIKQELAAESETAEGFLKDKIETQEAADQAGIWAKRVADLAKRADGEREAEKKPHLEASRDVDNKWRDVISNAKFLATSLKRHVEPFLIEQKRKADEAARKARDEAEALRKQAAEADQKSEAERQALQQKAAEAERAATPTNARAGRTGATVSLRTEKRANIVDYDACFMALKDHADMRALVEQLAQRAVRAGVPLAGVEVVEVARAA